MKAESLPGIQQQSIRIFVQCTVLDSFPHAGFCGNYFNFKFFSLVLPGIINYYNVL